MDKVRDQLCASDATNLNRTLDLKSGAVKKDQRVGPPIHMSCRRGFICRMRLGNFAKKMFCFFRLKIAKF